MLICDSNKITASGTSTLDYVQALESHFNGPSNHFTLQNTLDDTGGSGDYGIEITPDDAGEGWAAAIYLYGSSNDIRAYIDPNDAIGDPIDPGNGGGGSSATSFVNDAWLPDMSSINPGPSEEFLLSETNNTIVFTLKRNTYTGSYFPYHAHLGKLIEPVFDSDPSYGLDGLAVVGALGGFNSFLQRAYRITHNDWERGNHYNNNSLNNNNPALPNGRIRPRLQAAHTEDTDQMLGFYRTYYHWSPSWSGRYDRIVDPSGDGGLVHLDDGIAVIWDPDVNPL